MARLGIGAYEEWQPGQKLKLLLVGYNGARNTGSDVRTAAIARQFKELFGPDQLQITVMTLDVRAVQGYFDEDVILLPFSSIFPWHIYRACSRNHAAILCEGSTLKSTFANALTLFMCAAAGIMSSQGKPCLAYGSEIGTMEPFLQKAASILCRQAYFIARTQASLAALKKLGLQGHAGTDAAWLFRGTAETGEAERLLRQQGWDGQKPLIGLAVINPFCWPVRASLQRWIRSILSGNRAGQYDKWYFFSNSPTRRTAYKRYIQSIADGVNAFCRDSGCFPVLIGMERLDEKACRQLKEKLPLPSAMFLAGDYSAGIIASILNSLSFLVTSRYHAAVLSMNSSCPITAISMDERLNNLMRELSLAQKYLLQAADPELAAKLYTALTQSRAEQAAIRQHILEYTARSRAAQQEMGVFAKRYILNALTINALK
ncbi:MAG: polysaccharide pyruvyl transferase family protein [bacterium]|nr:polysaccharide pyruvyl transferase family protein [bacterium]